MTWQKNIFSAIIAALVLSYMLLARNKNLVIPTVEEKWFGPGHPQQEDTTIKPFRINVSDEVITDLRYRLKNALPFQAPLEGVINEYGINTALLEPIIEYWYTKYDWKVRQEFLNQYPQFTTNIQGLNIHFIHVKPKNVPENVDVLPLLMSHGWGSSVTEYYEIIPLLTTPQPGKSFVFEIVAPSLPGFGFSDAASKPGLAPSQIAVIFNKLMKRLNFEKYYAHGGDFGSIVTQALAILYPDTIIAAHRNWCITVVFRHWEIYAGIFFPKLFFTEKEIERNYPLSDQFKNLLQEMGYFHIQATKPDTLGVALRDSPAGMAAYFLEKIITLTNSDWNHRLDGFKLLVKKISLDRLLDDLMIYWVTRSITTSMRLYVEMVTKEHEKLNYGALPITVPAACNRFKYEAMYPPEKLLKKMHTNLIHLTDYEDGGHFPALEVPEILANDLFEFVEKVRNLYKKSNKEEL